MSDIRPTHPDAIGHYRVVRQIGRGGMGIVYEAVDQRLQRTVALKTIAPSNDPALRDRFLREARAAASVSHPHICQLFEIGEHHGEPFIAMELLEGEPLSVRLSRGAVPAADAVALSLGILSALSALHARGIVHRDLKPSNVFVTRHGVKLLDFGLARPLSVDTETTSLTLPGIVLGTPAYMAPEQARGGEVDARADLFATGAILFEMLTGRPAFTGPSAIEVLHGVLNEQPPALVGSLAVVEVDRVIQRALAKQPADRYQTADEMARDLRTCLSRISPAEGASVRAATRLIVLPFRILRPDPSVDFLAYSLPDAITVSLSALESLVVRSSLSAARYAPDSDLTAVAREANVDAVVTGTLLHAGGLIRVSVQLVEAPSGTVRWSHTLQVPLDDLFSIQDAVASAVVDALELPLSTREQRQLHQDVPANPAAYAHYLQANRLVTSSSSWHLAREAYERAVSADPQYAPAWARLARCLRLLGKYGAGDHAGEFMQQAEDAFQQAFRLNPDLPLTHNLYTNVEVETGRALQAMLRLLGMVRTRTGDPDLYAGLVHACRYVGLLDASIAAWRRAVRLDPDVRTSVAHSFFMNGDYEQAIATDLEQPPYVSVISLVSLHRREEAIDLARTASESTRNQPHLSAVVELLTAVVENRADAGQQALSRLMEYRAFRDPEGWFYWAHGLAATRQVEPALDLLGRAVESGLACVRALETSPHFDPLRGHPRFLALLETASAARAAAARAFADADGHRILGIPAA